MAEENMGTPAPKEGLGKGAIIAIVAIGAIVVLGAGYAIGKYSSSKTSEEAVTQTPPVPDEPTAVASTTTSAATTATTLATDETASWKTYTNSQYGFSFKYPSNWSYKVNGNFVEFSENGKTYQIEASDAVPINIGFANSNGKTGYQIAQEDKLGTNIGDEIVTQVTIGGVSSSGKLVNYLQTVSIVVKSDSAIKISLLNSGSESENSSLGTVYSGILSTFQFTK